MAKIIGNTTATPNPRPDWDQTDTTKADYIKNKPVILTEDDVEWVRPITYEDAIKNVDKWIKYLKYLMQDK